MPRYTPVADTEALTLISLSGTPALIQALHYITPTHLSANFSQKPATRTGQSDNQQSTKNQTDKKKGQKKLMTKLSRLHLQFETTHLYFSKSSVSF